MIERTSREVNRHGWGVCERALELPLSWKDLTRIAKAKTGIGKSDLPGFLCGALICPLFSEAGRT
jgi:hypothetical protein